MAARRHPGALNDVAYPSALLLAGVFAWAGASKLRDRRGTSASFAAAGLPAPQILGTAVPVSEVLLAVGLVTVPAVGAYVALAMLAAFTTFLVLAIRSGSAAGCGCFGSARAEAASSVELLRNGLLAGAAVVAGFADGPEPPDPVATAVVAGVAVLAVALLSLVRRSRRRVGHRGR